MTTLPRVLAAGLDRAPGAISTQAFHSALQSQVTQAKTAGLDLELILIKPNTLEASLQDTRQRLREEKPELFLIGFGIRGMPEHTELFERLVNLWREESVGTKIGFNTSPGDTVQAARRGLGL